MDNNKITPDILYQFFILGILVKLGGSADTATVIKRIRENYGDKFSEKDLMETEKTKVVRWENNVKWARKHLVDAGYLEKGSPRGIWEITNEGRKKYKEWYESIQKNLSQGKEEV